ncbi:hypothetical protein M0804_011791 [Polistes exclamans]|nr:hypothetical protein M0804_011791 [Polistes exclamans]
MVVVMAMVVVVEACSCVRVDGKRSLCAKKREKRGWRETSFSNFQWNIKTGLGSGLEEGRKLAKKKRKWEKRGKGGITVRNVGGHWPGRISNVEVYYAETVKGLKSWAPTPPLSPNSIRLDSIVLLHFCKDTGGSQSGGDGGNGYGGGDAAFVHNDPPDFSHG